MGEELRERTYSEGGRTHRGRIIACSQSHSLSGRCSRRRCPLRRVREPDEETEIEEMVGMDVQTAYNALE